MKRLKVKARNLIDVLDECIKEEIEFDVSEYGVDYIEERINETSQHLTT